MLPGRVLISASSLEHIVSLVAVSPLVVCKVMLSLP